MKVFYCLEVDETDQEKIGNAAEFVDKYSRYWSDGCEDAYEDYYSIMSIYSFTSEEKLIEAVSDASKMGLSVRRTYELKLEPNELETYPALCITPQFAVELFINNDANELVDASALDTYGIVREFDSERTFFPFESNRIVVSLEIKQILDKITSCINWQQRKTTTSKECFVMEIKRSLPRPLIVVSPLLVYQIQDKLPIFYVESDGREAICNENIAFLSEHGLSISTEAQTPFGVFQWYPRLVVSGKVMHALQLVGMEKKLESFIPLLSELHPLLNK